MSKDFKQIGKARIFEAKKATTLAAWDYMRHAPEGHLEAVLCCRCGVQISGLVEAEKRGFTRREGGQIVKYKFLIWAEFPNYAVATIRFKDGSAHEHPMCKTCAANLSDDDAAQVYACALDRLDTIDRTGALAWHMLAEKEVGELEEKE